MCKLYVFYTTVGPFFIAYSRGQYRILHEDEIVGSFETPEDAARHMAFRNGFAVAGGINTAMLGIPANLRHWESCQPAAMAMAMGA